METTDRKYRIAVHVHLHYVDLFPLIASYLVNVPVPFDLFVTITHPEDRQVVNNIVAEKIPNLKLIVRDVENRGRDVKPFYVDIGYDLLRYDIVCHIHGKKSTFNNGATSGWLEYMLDSLLGSTDRVLEILSIYRSTHSAGLIYPERFFKLPYWANTWLSNKGWAAILTKKLGIGQLPETYFSYPVGNMFWARTNAIKRLIELDLPASQFPAEPAQTDGELMHTMERMVSVVSSVNGFINYTICPHDHSIQPVNDRKAREVAPYFNQSLDNLRQATSDPAIKLVSFDIFDTLIFRSLTRPEDIFDLMQRDVEALTNEPADFKKLRMDADAFQRARLQPGTDVTLISIYERLGDVLGIDEAAQRRLQELEMALEHRFMKARSSIVKVMDDCYDRGLTVVLTSDTYFEKSELTELLRALGIVKFHRMYLSSAAGKRKDNRTLFPYLLTSENVQPNEMLHIGDNEQSDLQVPGDLGIKAFHVMRASELFLQSTLGQSNSIGDFQHLSLASRISLGLCLTKIFDNPFPRFKSLTSGNLETFGYLYFGPVLLEFVEWVMHSARKDNIDQVYFLSRDGEIMMKIYELLKPYLDPGHPVAHYLEVSRRSLGAPFIRTENQLDKILQPDYFGGSLNDLLTVRLGVSLSRLAGLDVRQFGFDSIQQSVFLPADYTKVKALASFIVKMYPQHLNEERSASLGYLSGLGLFQNGKKAVVDIGYSGSMQRILNEISGDEAIDGYYMVLYNSIEPLLEKTNARAKGLFGDKIDPRQKTLSIDRYSLFYEMILSAGVGPVLRYERNDDYSFVPVYSAVSEKEAAKLEKLPKIHAGILRYCEEYLALTRVNQHLPRADHHYLLAPFQYFMEHPEPEEIEMLAGYSLDDDYCGQGIVYWVPPHDQPAFAGNNRFTTLWEQYAPQAFRRNAQNGSPESSLPGNLTRREYDVFARYQENYEALPGWYKKIGQIFKIMQGKKRLRLVLEDVGYNSCYNTKIEEIQGWYNKEYEVLPNWYKRFGQVIKPPNVKSAIKLSPLR